MQHLGEALEAEGYEKPPHVLSGRSIEVYQVPQSNSKSTEVELRFTSEDGSTTEKSTYTDKKLKENMMKVSCGSEARITSDKISR